MAVDPPDRPTRPLTPRPPAPRERIAGAPAADAALVDWLHDSVRSLRTALALVGLLAVTALGVAIYALLAADDSGAGRSTGSTERIGELDDRVDRLSRQVQDVRAGSSGDADAGDLEALKERLDDTASASDLKSLRDTVAQLSSGGGTGTAEDPSSEVTELGQRLDELAKDVQELQSAQPPP